MPWEQGESISFVIRLNMIESVRSSDRYIYHYTKPETAIDFILPNGNLRFSPFRETNDPKESKEWFFEYGSNEGRDFAKYNAAQLSAWLSSTLKDSAQLLCFSGDKEGLSGNHLQDIFSRGFCKPRMWAQYANNHTGICLVFDRARLTQEVESQLGTHGQILKGEVEYYDQGIARKLFDHREQEFMINIDHLEKVGRSNYVADHFSTHYRRLFFEKMSDWKDENEWRYLIHTQDSESKYVEYRSSLVGLMFGENTQDDVIEKAMTITKGRGLRYMGLKWRNSSPWYDYGNLRYLGMSPKPKRYGG